jgi:hypothetical protein
MKCLATGMRREAVQEERTRSNNGRESRDGRGGNNDNEVESTSGGGNIGGDMPIDRIVEAENICEKSMAAGGNNLSTGGDASMDIRMHSGFANDVGNHTTRRKMLHQLVAWAKHIPLFSDLKLDDQVSLIRSGWNELLIAGFAFRSTHLEEGILWADGQVITRENAHVAGVGEIFDRVLVELVGKMKEMKMVRLNKHFTIVQKKW